MSFVICCSITEFRDKEARGGVKVKLSVTYGGKVVVLWFVEGWSTATQYWWLVGESGSFD